MGRFTVQWLDGQWYVGAPDAAQRIDGDGHWLDSWLLANGASDRTVLDFDGDAVLEQRFSKHFAGDSGPAADADDDAGVDAGIAGVKGRHRRIS